jgi:signal peptidase I
MTEQASRPSRGRRFAHTLKEVALVVVILLLARTAVAEPYYVPSGSMEPTLASGDRLLVDKYSYGYSRFSLPGIPGLSSLFPRWEERLFGKLPERGDVVVFRLPSDEDTSFVKRVIGLPGDKIQMRGGDLWLNGQEVPVRDTQDEIGSPIRIESLPGGREYSTFERNGWGQFDDTREFTVPPGHLFVMGDNRDNSLDSRVMPSQGGVGILPVENLVGRVDLVLASWEIGITSLPFRDWPSAIRFDRFFSRVD